MTVQRMTSSRYRAWHRCVRLHHYRYELRVVPLVTPAALIFGTLFHLALETWWTCWRDGRGDEALDRALAALRCAFPEQLDPMVCIQLVALMYGYDARWASAMAHIEVLHVEKQFDGPLVDPDTGAVARTFRVAGKIDALVRIAGDVYVVEHKTTSSDLSPGSSYWLRLRMDPQLSIYMDAAKLLGYPDVAGCIYDVIAKPTIQPHEETPLEQRKYTKGKRCNPCEKAGEPDPGCQTCKGTGWKEPPRLYGRQHERDETADEYRERLVAAIRKAPEGTYQRATVVRLDDELVEGRRDLWATARLMVADPDGRAPRSLDACFRYGAACEYFGVCSGAASLSDPTRFKRLSTAHPELREVA